MQPLLVRPELEHVTEDGDPTAPGRERRLGKEVERRGNADRRGVVRVVDEGRAGARLRDLHAVIGMAAGGERLGRLVDPDAQPLGDRKGRQRMRDEVGAGGSAPQPHRCPRRAHGELGSGQPLARDVGRADVGGRPEAERADLRGGHLRHGRHARIVGVQDRQPVGGERGRQLGLRARDPLDAPGALEMGRMHGQHDADLGSGDLREPRDLTDGVHAHLEDGRLVRGLEPKQGHRQPGLGVEVPLVPQRGELAREDVGGDLLGDRLARGTGDADDAHRMARPPPGGQVLEGAERVRHDDLGCVAQVGGEVNGSLDEHCGGAGSERVGDERVSIGSLAGKRDEDGPGADAARVDRRTGDRGRGRRSGPREPAAGGAEHVLEADRWRHTHPAADFGRV